MELRLPPIRDLHLSQPDYSPPPPRDERLAKVRPLVTQQRPHLDAKQVLSLCQSLCSFAEHYASPVASNPDQSEIAQMVARAVEVITILEDYKRASCPPPAAAAPASAVTARPPKRPWEDADEEQAARRVAASPPADRPSPGSSSSPAPRVPHGQEAHMHVFDGVPERVVPMDDDAKAVAARDMEDIRARRGTANGAAQGKVKYKKRSRASPPGQCHSCEILDTPEWRRGPDGQRTLCNACGLHYAKLVRKRDRIISSLPAGGQVPPPIDITFLRKSARLAAENSALARSVGRRVKDKSPKAESPASKNAPSEPEGGAGRDAGSGLRGWSRREDEHDEPMASPIHNAFPRQATSPFPPPPSGPQMSPSQLASPVMTLPPPAMSLPPPGPQVHPNTLPSMRPYHPPPMASYPPPGHPGSYPPTYAQPPPPYPPMQQPYGPPPHGYAQPGPVMGGPMPAQPQPNTWDRYVAGINGREHRN
ncbi:hypothetical protein FRC07_012841 [Ceratobasidium sp. 392]|nr:hypothetical protein FRC07_012841 [Ceratobasidium sp. 392]